VAGVPGPFAKAKAIGLEGQSDSLRLLKRLQKMGLVGRCMQAGIARTVVRQRLVEASHHARERNAPAQSMSD
jgi:hypothetical protein